MYFIPRQGCFRFERRVCLSTYNMYFNVDILCEGLFNETIHDVHQMFSVADLYLCIARLVFFIKSFARYLGEGRFRYEVMSSRWPECNGYAAPTFVIVEKQE